MAELRGRYQLGKPNLYSIAQSMDKIQKDFHHTLTGFKGIKVNRHDRQDRADEKSGQEVWTREATEQLERHDK